MKIKFVSFLLFHDLLKLKPPLLQVLPPSV